MSPPAAKDLTAAEREWIRRQGLTARVLAAEQRRVRERLLSSGPQVGRVRERLKRERRADEFTGAPRR